jgi:hypothetical protein
MSALEQAIQDEARSAIGSLPDVRLWRNNVGELLDSRGIPVKYGLAVGSADTIGIVAPHGRLLSLEFKRPGYKPSGARQLQREQEQQWWRDIINRFGGIALRVESLEQAFAGVALVRAGQTLLEGTIYPGDLVARKYHSDVQWLLEDWQARRPRRKEKKTRP